MLLLLTLLAVLQHLTVGERFLNFGKTGSTPALCQTLWNNQRTIETGELCIETHSWNNPHFIATYTTNEDWVLNEAYLWLGTDTENFPRNISEIQFKNDTIGKKDSLSFVVPLETIDSLCLPTDDLLSDEIGLPHNDTVFVESIVIQENTRGDNLTTEGTASSANTAWNSFTITLSCPNLEDSPDETPFLESLCPTVTDEEAKALGERFFLSSDFIKKVEILTNLSWTTLEADVYNQTLQESYYETFQYWEDEADDMHVLAKSEGVCYAAFRGTQGGSVWDFAQNIFIGPRKVEGSNCFVRSGFYAAYYTKYVESFRSAVDVCVRSCDGGCELVLGGASQGAAAAFVAAIDLRGYDPLVIGIGGAKAVYGSNWWNLSSDEECTDLDNLRIFRLTFLQLERTHGGTIYDTHYDQVPFDFGYGASHFGDQIIIDTEGRAVNVGTDQKDRFPKLSFFHQKNFLLKWLTTFTSQPCVPVESSGWPNGHWCSLSDECASGRCASNVCQSQSEYGEDCASDADCVSGHCTRVSFFSFRKECQ